MPSGWAVVSAVMAPDDDGPAVDVVETEVTPPAAADPTEFGEIDEYTALAGKRIEDWRIAKLNRIAKERENALAAGDLLDLATVSARISQAGVAFQRGQAAARRSIDAVCCDGCRDAVVVAFDGAENATIIAVRGALEGGMTVRIMVGDALSQLATQPDGSVHCVVTSPPVLGSPSVQGRPWHDLVWSRLSTAEQRGTHRGGVKRGHRRLRACPRSPCAQSMGGAPRATRRALNRLARGEGPVGPRGQAWAGWSVQLAVGV